MHRIRIKNQQNIPSVPPQCISLGHEIDCPIVKKYCIDTGDFTLIKITTRQQSVKTLCITIHKTVFPLFSRNHNNRCVRAAVGCNNRHYCLTFYVYFCSDAGEEVNSSFAETYALSKAAVCHFVEEVTSLIEIQHLSCFFNAVFFTNVQVRSMCLATFSSDTGSMCWRSTTQTDL